MPEDGVRPETFANLVIPSLDDVIQYGTPAFNPETDPLSALLARTDTAVGNMVAEAVFEVMKR